MTGQQLAPIVGLTVALGGTALLVSPASRLLGRPDGVATKVLEQVVLWVLLAIVVSVVLFWERRPLTSLWLQPLRWQSLGWGLAFAAAMVWLLFPLRLWLVRVAGLPGFQAEAGLERVLALPLWLRLVMVITAGVVEETLFHGYGLTRLGELLGSYWLAALLLVAIFAAVHVPYWGLGFALGLVPVAATSAAFFIWKQDLFALIVAHTVSDAVGFIVAPPISE